MWGQSGGGGPANAQDLNRYSYVLNNPVRLTDPTGHLVPLALLPMAAFITKVVAKAAVGYGVRVAATKGASVLMQTQLSANALRAGVSVVAKTAMKEGMVSGTIGGAATAIAETNAGSRGLDLATKTGESFGINFLAGAAGAPFEPKYKIGVNSAVSVVASMHVQGSSVLGSVVTEGMNAGMALALLSEPKPPALEAAIQLITATTTEMIDTYVETVSSDQDPSDD
ncbi:MAG: hypothetical protein Fur005_44190 [Roseiflexaceae bacterium]